MLGSIATEQRPVRFPSSGSSASASVLMSVVGVILDQPLKSTQDNRLPDTKVTAEQHTKHSYSF